MQVQINAAARLVTAASAADAGKIVLWIQKATGAQGKKHGKAGKQEGMDFKIGSGKSAVNISVLLDHAYEPPLLLLEGGCAAGEWSAEEKTGRQSILSFKNQLRETLAEIKGDKASAGMAEVLKKLIKAKSKVETE